MKWGFLSSSDSSLPAIQETQVQSLVWEGPLDKEMDTHSRILPLSTPWTEELVGYCPWGQKESDMLLLLSHFSHV